MKQFITLLFIPISKPFFAELDYNTKKDFIAEGYDVVEYFNNKAVKGSKKFQTTFDCVKFMFYN